MSGWKWVAASVRGTAHAGDGVRRQDAARVLTTDAGFLIVVACDGAGSTSHGGLGAALAARALSSRASRWIDLDGALPTAELIEGWVYDIRETIALAAMRRGLTSGDFATTLVAAISNGTATITAQIGDGAIIARERATACLVALSWPENGEYAAMTYFLTDAAPHLRIGMVDGIALECLAVMTDGLERLALDFARRAPHEPFFARMFAPVANSPEAGHNHALSRQLANFLDSEPVNSRSDDDKTLILASL